jgi:ribosomal protein L35AE/L33A
MSEETKELIKNKPTLEDYEKAKKNFNNEEYSPEEFLTLAKLYSDSFRDVKEGEMIKGRIVRVQGDNIIVDVGFKSEGTIPKIEFNSPEEYQVGREVEVVLESVEDQEGNLVLSKQRADFLRVWEKVVRAHETGEILQGKIVKRIKGGMVVDLMGMEAFFPVHKLIYVLSATLMHSLVKQWISKLLKLIFQLKTLWFLIKFWLKKKLQTREMPFLTASKKDKSLKVQLRLLPISVFSLISAA